MKTRLVGKFDILPYVLTSLEQGTLALSVVAYFNKAFPPGTVLGYPVFYPMWAGTNNSLP